MASLPFAPQEYEKRLTLVKQKMSQEGLNALIVTGPENIYYVSGFRAVLASALSPLMAVVIPAEGDPRLITRKLEMRAANDQWTRQPFLFMDHEDPFQLLAEILTASGAAQGVIGAEESNLTVWRLNRMKQALPEAAFKDASKIVKSLMAVPSPTEVDYIRRAGKLANGGFQGGLKAVKKGIYCYEVIAAINHTLFQAGQTDTLLSRIWCWAGPDGGQMHSTDVTHQIQDGDLVTIELGGVYNLYRVNAQGTVYIGKHPPELVVKTYEMVANMYKAAAELIRPGAKAGEIYEGANRIYRPLKGEDYFRRLGGSMSLGSFDINVIKGNQEVLHPGLPLLIQPLVNEPFLITCSSTILVTETGREELTQPLLELMTI